MGSPMSFALPSLERDFQSVRFQQGLPFSIFYHTASVALSVGLGFSLFQLPNSGVDWWPEILMHLCFVLLAFTVQHLLVSRSELYRKIMVPLNVFLRVSAALRCFSMRRTFSKPPMFDSALSLQSFFFDYCVGVLVIPYMVHVEGLPLPFGLHTATFVFMLFMMMSNNHHYCGETRLGAFAATSGTIAKLARWTSPFTHFVLGYLIPNPVGPTALGVPRQSFDTCEAQLAVLQIFPMLVMYVYGIVREVKMRRLFLSAKHPHLHGASRWPLDGAEVMTAIGQTVFAAVACSVFIWEGYLAYLSTLA